MAKFGVGQSVRRVEDQRFITGTGRYTDDINLPGQAYGYALRSPEAHARIAKIDVAEAKLAPGVLAIITGAEIEAKGTNALPCAIPMESRISFGKRRLYVSFTSLSTPSPGVFSKWETETAPADHRGCVSRLRPA